MNKETLQLIESHIDKMRRLVLDYPYANNELKKRFMKSYNDAYKLIKEWENK
jgi:hypothetical protein